MAICNEHNRVVQQGLIPVAQAIFVASWISALATCTCSGYAFLFLWTVHLYSICVQLSQYVCTYIAR